MAEASRVGYLIVTGTTTASRAGELVAGLLTMVEEVITIATPHAARVIAPRELSSMPGNRLVESYFDAAILPRPPEGLLLVAPCSFNSLNKLAQGIADNLALSVAAEAIGRGTPVLVAVSVNAPLWHHPQAARSVATLREWGVEVIEPVNDADGYLRLASAETILNAVRLRSSRY